MNHYVPREGMETVRINSNVNIAICINHYVPREGMETDCAALHVLRYPACGMNHYVPREGMETPW